MDETQRKDELLKPSFLSESLASSQEVREEVDPYMKKLAESATLTSEKFWEQNGLAKDVFLIDLLSSVEVTDPEALRFSLREVYKYHQTQRDTLQESTSFRNVMLYFRTLSTLDDHELVAWAQGIHQQYQERVKLLEDAIPNIQNDINKITPEFLQHLVPDLSTHVVVLNRLEYILVRNRLTGRVHSNEWHTKPSDAILLADGICGIPNEDGERCAVIILDPDIATDKTGKTHFELKSLEAQKVTMRHEAFHVACPCEVATNTNDKPNTISITTNGILKTSYDATTGEPTESAAISDYTCFEEAAATIFQSAEPTFMEHMPERYHLAMYLFRDVFDGDLISYQQIRLIHSTEYVDKLLEATPEIQTRVKAVSKLFTHGIDTNFGIKYE